MAGCDERIFQCEEISYKAFACFVAIKRHCKLLLLTFAFEVWGLERLEFRADARNTASINAMKAIGCIEEGIFRNHMPTTQGGRRDSIVLSILKDEWFGEVKERLTSIVY